MKTRFLAASMIFLALTAVKLTQPHLSLKIKELLIPKDSVVWDSTQNAAILGLALSGEAPVLEAWEDDAAEETAETPTELTQQNVEGFELEKLTLENLHTDAYAKLSALPQGTDSPQPPCSAAESDTETELQVRMAAFLEEQAAFTDAALPANVSLEAPELGLDSAAPAAADITSGFGYRLHPIYGDLRFHYGADLNLTTGEPITAFADGCVSWAGEISGYGLTIMIDHGQGISSLYAHCSSLETSAGDSVQKGQIVALAGSTGNVTGPHLHFELTKDGMYLNPELYL